MSASRCVRILLTAFVAVICVDVSARQPAGANYDESKVPAYTLPDPLVCNDGRRSIVRNVARSGDRRFALLRPMSMARPGRSENVKYEVEKSENAIGEKRSASRWRLRFPIKANR